MTWRAGGSPICSDWDLQTVLFSINQSLINDSGHPPHLTSYGLIVTIMICLHIPLSLPINQRNIFWNIWKYFQVFSVPELINKMSFVNSLVYQGLTATEIFVKSKIFLIFFFRIMKMLRVILMILWLAVWFIPFLASDLKSSNEQRLRDLTWLRSSITASSSYSRV